MANVAVYICDCEGLVSDHVDTEALERRAAELPHVALVRRVGRLCAREDLARLAEELRASGADHLLYAGCSPRMSLRLPEDRLFAVAAEAGLDPSRVEVANIREQCAWLHTDDREGASAKARDMLAMAHARLLRRDAPAEDVPLERGVLVVGGGPAGLAALRDLTRAGLPVTLVEKHPYLGGTLCQLPFMFQTEAWPSSCESKCVGPVHAADALLSPLCTLYNDAEVTALHKRDGNFQATVRLAPRFVDPDLCIACGKCTEVCPEETDDRFNLGLTRRKAIAKPFARAVPDASSIIDEACTRCGECVEVCPTGAINLEAKPAEVQVSAGAVIVATGTEQRDPALSPELGAGLPNVVTSLELERIIAGGLRRPSDGEEPEHIVFVQCAGSRAGMEKQGSGVPYCSKTCCSITAKQAKRLAVSAPMTEVSILYYRDFRTYERALEKLYQDVKGMGLELHNGEVSGIVQNPEEEEGLLVRYSPLGSEELEDDGEEQSLECDMVVLACAQQPRTPKVITDLGVPLDAHGFPMENQPRIFRPTETFVDRVYSVGAGQGPKAVQQAVEQGSAAAMQAVQALGKGLKTPLKYASQITLERCTRCGVCVEVCPHGAITLDEEGAFVETAFCQGCGLCAASCASHAAQLRNFGDERLLAEAQAAFAEVPEGEPRILALLCYWCSYGGVDLAGLDRRSIPASVRTMRIRCSSSVNLGVILQMFRLGIDGIVVGGCPENSCHHLWGNWLAQKRTALMKALMRQMGLSDSRLRYENIGIMHSQKFKEIMDKMYEQLRAMGPNPWSERGAAEAGEAAWLAR